MSHLQNFSIKRTLFKFEFLNIEIKCVENKSLRKVHKIKIIIKLRYRFKISK